MLTLIIEFKRGSKYIIIKILSIKYIIYNIYKIQFLHVIFFEICILMIYLSLYLYSKNKEN